MSSLFSLKILPWVSTCFHLFFHADFDQCRWSREGTQMRVRCEKFYEDFAPEEGLNHDLNYYLPPGAVPDDRTPAGWVRLTDRPEVLEGRRLNRYGVMREVEILIHMREWPTPTPQGRLSEN